VQRRPDLLEVIETLEPCGRLTDTLAGWKQESQQDPDQPDAGEHFDEAQPRTGMGQVRRDHLCPVLTRMEMGKAHSWPPADARSWTVPMSDF
jgi:hypothetical protein